MFLIFRRPFLLSSNLGFSSRASGSQLLIRKSKLVFIWCVTWIVSAAHLQDHDIKRLEANANMQRATDDQFERFHADVKQKFDRHLNEHEGKFQARWLGSSS